MFKTPKSKNLIVWVFPYFGHTLIGVRLPDSARILGFFQRL
jgi:hypothetical protein